MKCVLALVLAVFLSTPLAATADAPAVGVRMLSMPMPERGTELPVALWYPAAAGGIPAQVGENAVFAGSPALLDAPIAGGSFPIILLSHGGLRSAPGLGGWIASRLAAQGFVVAAVSGPGAHLNPSDAWREIWLRPADLTEALTALVQDPALTGRIDLSRAGVLGFQFGGSAALAMAGATYDAEAYARSCDDGATGPDCAWFARHGLDLRHVDGAKVRRSNPDPRIDAVVVVDPENAALFTPASLSRIQVPVQVITLGEPDARVTALAAIIPHANHATIGGATKFDGFSRCRAEGAAILREEGDDERLCADGDRPRAQVHDELAAMILAAFARDLPAGF